MDPYREALEKLTENIYPYEPPIEIMENNNHWKNAERLNGWLAMLGVVAGIGAYAVTGQLLPGVF
tara:strand:- start:680 stop:874 length:195 start_codon:yes stop_codon:yes gene_type:complete